MNVLSMSARPMPGRQQGQAMVESLTVMLALLPFVIAIPLIAKYQDIRHATLSAARTASFECSVRVENCTHEASRRQINEQIRRRHFSRHHINLHSDDTVDDSMMADERRRFWSGRNGQPMLASFGDVSLSISQEKADAVRELKLGSLKVGKLATALSKFAGPDAFGLPLNDGLVTAQVQSRVKLDDSFGRHLPAGLLPEHLNFRERSVVLVDAWNASSARGSEARSLASRVEQGRRLPAASTLLQELGRFTHLAPLELIGEAIPRDDPEKALRLFYRPLETVLRNDPLLNKNRRGQFHHYEVDVEVLPTDRVPTQ